MTQHLRKESGDFFSGDCRARSDSYLRRLPSFNARVAGIFNRSFTAIVDESCPFPLLVNFHTDPLALHPLGILISKEILARMTGTESICVKPDAVLIGHQTFPLVFDISIPALSESQYWITPTETLKKLKSIVSTLGRLSAAGRAVCGELSEAYGKFAELLLCKPSPLSLAAFLPWIGSGEGSTPSCDDILTGFLLVDRHLPNSFFCLQGITGRDTPETTNGWNTVCGSSDSFWKKARARTPLTSLWQLFCAAQGQCSIIFERLGIEMSQGRLTSADVLRCIGYGYNSGTDLLCGMLARWGRAASVEKPTERKE